MAEARSAVAEPRVKELDEGRDSWKDIATAWKISICRLYFRTRNSIRNGMWPTSIYNLGSTVVFLFLLLEMEPNWTSSLNRKLWRVRDVLHLPQGFPRMLHALIISSLVGFCFFLLLMTVRQYLLRMLLAYRGWMYEAVHTHSKWTLLWCICVKFLSGYCPSLYSCQRSLPRLYVPPLKDTVRGLIKSLVPICSGEEIEGLKNQAKEFEATVGPKLQKILVLKSWISPNYVSDWWEKYVYLRSRSPIAINSNYYCLDHSYWAPTTLPCARTAAIVYNFLCFKRLIDREQLKPLMLRKTVPICMAQYERALSTVRVPGEDMDEIRHFESKVSKHVIIVHKGLYYKLECYDVSNKLLVPSILEQQVEWIVKDAEKHAGTVSEESKSIAALTTLGRTEWAQIRKQFLRKGVNKESLRAIEQSIFFVNLVDYVPKDLSDQGKQLLHGDGKSIWFDKCVSVVIFSNAKLGLNCEHSFADAPILAHIMEYSMSKEVLEREYDDDGHCMPPSQTHRQRGIKTPQRLVWEVLPSFSEKIHYALHFSKKNADDLDLLISDHNSWGKGLMKKFKVSPDAFIQMAIQLAYYRDYRKFVQTYEACMTRMYLCGRTETVRSCTKDATEFVKAMTDNNVSREETIRLLHVAAERHQKFNRDGMNGMGIDRHLFALYVACKGLRYDSPFLDSIISRPWTLSTSQTPHNQIENNPDTNLKLFDNKLGAGGGFGPVSDEGYGISYIIPNDKKIFFHVSSKVSCSHTDSKRFMKQIFDSLEDMRALFQSK